MLVKDKNLDKNKVAVGMSGGVDSTVAAYILKQRGYDVIGITMNLFDDEGCCSALKVVEDAKRIAHKMGIPHYVVDLKDEFKQKVMDYFVDEYISGKTPNPCIACNRYIKFDAFINIAHKYGAYYVATGHYSGVEYNDKTSRYLVRTAREKNKDQTYMFWSLKQYQLKYILTPLSEISSKDEVRKIAVAFDILSNDKKESQEICFIPDNDHVKYLTNNIKSTIPTGHFIDIDGNIVGEHKGIINYTIGQRKGLGVSFGKPMYVIKIIPDTNEIVLGDNKSVFSDGLIGEDINFISFEKLTDTLRVKAKIRSHAKEADCSIQMIENDRIKVVFDCPQRAITAGQSVVFYKDEYMIGGANIVNSFNIID